MTQYARPITDESIGGWTTDSSTTTNLYQRVDEVVASSTDYVQSASWPTSDTLKFKLSTISDPLLSTDHIVSYRIGAEGSLPTNLTVRILQGVTPIAEWDHLDVSSTPTDITQTLSGTQADAITDYTNLYLEFVATTGIAYVFRDTFDGSIDSAWTITGSATTYDNKLSISGNGTWNARRILLTNPITRQAGRTLSAVVLCEDRAASAAVGWATGVVSDPTTDGHSWLNTDGHFELATPGAIARLSGTGNDTAGSQRDIEYLVSVVLRDQGAFYLISTFTDYQKLSSHSHDEVGIPQFPDARVLWVADHGTTSSLYPFISVGTTIGYTNGLLVDDLRIVDVASWSTDQAFMTLLERFTRADSTTSLGGSWATSGNGVWGISSNQAYMVSGSGFNHAYINSGLNGDGIWRVNITIPTTPTNGFGVVLRRVDANNFLRLWNNGSSAALYLQTWVAGGFGDTVAVANPVSWTAGQTYTWEVHTKGNLYQIYVDGVMLTDWTADSNNRHLTGTGFGPYTSTNPTGARWDNFLALPHTITLPSELQDGATPHIFSPGTILMQDTFTGSDGAAINGRTPDTVGSGTWEVIGTGFQISGNSLINTNIDGADADYFALYDVGVGDVEITATVTTPAAGDIIRSGLAFRVGDASDSVRARMFMHPSQPANDEVEVWEFKTPYNANDFHKQWLADFYTLSTTYTLKAQIKGKLLHFFINGQPIVSYYLVANHTSTKFGIYHNGLDDGCVWNDITIRSI